MTQVAAIQMASGSNLNANLIEAGRLIRNAVEAGAELVVLPENFAMMGLKDRDNLNFREAPGSGPIQEFLSQQARQHGVWIIGGTFPMQSPDPNRAYSASVVFDARGNAIQTYHKIHLFDVHIDSTGENYHESEIYQPGDHVTLVDTPFGKIGLAICYDLRFPELFRAMVSQGAQILVVPSSFTAITGKAHWEVLCRARAIENLSYLIAAGQGGYHVNGRETYGDSMVVDPWGQVLDRLAHGSGYVLAKMDIQHVESLRRTFPVIQHRRLFCEITPK